MSFMQPLDFVNLSPFMERTIGRAEIRVALIDGPVAMDHPDLSGQSIREVAAKVRGACSRASSVACTRANVVAAISRTIARRSITVEPRLDPTDLLRGGCPHYTARIKIPIL